MKSAWGDWIRFPKGGKELNAAEHDLYQKIQRCSKTDLHVHVEGCFDATVNNTPKLEGKEAEFFARWRQNIESLRVEEDFVRAAETFVRGQALSGVVWTEAHISPPDCAMRPNNPIPFEKVVTWWLSAFERVSTPALEVRLIVDLVRLYPPNQALKWLQTLLEVRQKGSAALRIIGIGLGGPQDAHPLGDYKDVVALARAQGLAFFAHAGEMGSIADVRAALSLKPKRLAHCIGLEVEDDLRRSVAQARTPVESCPSSSLQLGAVASLQLHPVDEWIKRGILVTLGSDDPGLLHTDLNWEYVQLARTFDWTEATVAQIIKNGFEVSLMPENLKDDYLRKVEGHFSGAQQQ